LLVIFEHAGPLFTGVERIDIEVAGLVRRLRRITFDDDNLEDSIELREGRAYQLTFYTNGKRKGSIMVVALENRQVTAYSSKFTIGIRGVGLVDPQPDASAFPD